MTDTPTGNFRFTHHKPGWHAPVLALEVEVTWRQGPPGTFGLPEHLAGKGWRLARVEDLTHPNLQHLRNPPCPANSPSR